MGVLVVLGLEMYQVLEVEVHVVVGKLKDKT